MGNMKIRSCELCKSFLTLIIGHVCNFKLENTKLDQFLLRSEQIQNIAYILKINWLIQSCFLIGSLKNDPKFQFKYHGVSIIANLKSTPSISYNILYKIYQGVKEEINDIIKLHYFRLEGPKICLFNVI